MMAADLQQQRIVGYYVSAMEGRSGEKSAIRGNRKNREAPDEGAFILEKKGRQKKWKLWKLTSTILNRMKKTLD